MRAIALATVLAVLSLTGCGGGKGAAGERTLTVFAAASLSSAFTDLTEQFEEQHAGVDVRLSFGGSSTLAAQIAEGAPADVFAAADEPTMEVVEDAGVARVAPVVVATNTIQVATLRGSGPVETVEDLGDADVKVVLCAAQVPCGAAARKALAASGVEVAPVSEEQSVSDVMGKVLSGEADAGVVYRTDVLAASGRVRGIDLPLAAAVANRYPVVALEGASDPDLADDFVAFVAGTEGRALLASAGFGAP